MIDEKIVVSDTNIFLDLMDIDLLNEFCNLPCEIHTTDFIIAEIKKSTQQATIQSFIQNKKITVKKFNFTELSEISNLKANCHTNASIQDCSVWFEAKNLNCLLITGDKKLRTVVENDNVKVSGILYIFDKLVELNIISPNMAADKIKALCKLNCRLPKRECEERISRWEK